MKKKNFEQKCQLLINKIWDTVRKNPKVFNPEFIPGGLDVQFVKIKSFETYIPDKALINDELKVYYDENIEHINHIEFNIGQYRYLVDFYNSDNSMYCAKEKLYFSGMYNCLTNEYHIEVKPETIVNNLQKLLTKLNNQLEKVRKLRPELLRSAEV